MKLLICTQVLDKNHPILGFFHRWVEEFAKHCEEVHVICLQKGEYTLPAHVHVHSLGKEEGENKFKYLFRFYTLIWKLRHNYDHVFVHMNQIYVILGALLWRMWEKKIGLWYAHGAVSSSLKLAEKLTHLIFTSTEEGLRLNTPKRRIVGQGIDTEHFAYKERTYQSNVLRLITVGRISQSKNINTLIDACALLRDHNLKFAFSIIGIALTDEEKVYEKQMRQKCSDLNLDDHVVWIGAVSQKDLPAQLHEADIFIHDGATKSLDKALLEAVACGCIVVSSNEAYKSLTQSIAPQYLFDEGDSQTLSHIVVANASEDNGERINEVRKMIYREHSIHGLSSRIMESYNE